MMMSVIRENSCSFDLGKGIMSIPKYLEIFADLFDSSPRASREIREVRQNGKSTK